MENGQNRRRRGHERPNNRRGQRARRASSVPDNLNASHRRGPWRSDEDNRLLAKIRIVGPYDWLQISHTVVSRSSKQCRERWQQNLRPDLDHGPIRPEEEALILEQVRVRGNAWAAIGRMLQVRSDNFVKNWYNGQLNRERRRRRESDRQALRARSMEAPTVTASQAHPEPHPHPQAHPHALPHPHPHPHAHPHAHPEPHTYPHAHAHAHTYSSPRAQEPQTQWHAQVVQSHYHPHPAAGETRSMEDQRREAEWLAKEARQRAERAAQDAQRYADQAHYEAMAARHRALQATYDAQQAQPQQPQPQQPQQPHQAETEASPASTRASANSGSDSQVGNQATERDPRLSLHNLVNHD